MQSAQGFDISRKLLQMARSGQSAYACVDGEEVIDLPATCIRGRSGGCGHTFSGFLNLQTGSLRLDSNNLAFWLEADLFCSSFDGEDVIVLPSACIRGRSGAWGNTFSGSLNLRTGTLRLDSNDPAFWLEANLFSAPAFAAAP